MESILERIGLEKIQRTSDGNPTLDDAEEILESFDNIQLIIGSDIDKGIGKLLMCDGRILWLSSEDTSLGYTVDFTSISMHAVSTDPESFDKPCIYIQLDQEESPESMYMPNDTTLENGNETHDDDNDNDNDDILPELKLIPTPSSTEILESLFDAFCKGAERNPDFGIEEEGQGSFFFNQDEALAGAFQPGIDDDDEDEDDYVDDEEVARFEDADHDEK